MYGPATKANVIAALKTFTAGKPTAPIDLLIFTTGHGAANQLYSDPSTNPVDLLLWGVGEKITDQEFVCNLPANARISMMMEQCNGGGFKNDFIPASGLTRVLATAAKGNQASHSNDFSYYWITGVAGHDSVPSPNTHFTNADADGNFQVSMYEAYYYANKADPSGPYFGNVETPTFNQFGASAGATQFSSTCINEYSIPVATPSAALNGVSRILLHGPRRKSSHP